MNLAKSFRKNWVLFGLMFLAAWPVMAAEKSDKPVFLYSRRFNAIGENRYLPDGNYKEVLGRLSQDFKMIANELPLTAKTLEGVKVVLIANPSDKASGTNPPPHHIGPKDIEALKQFVKDGGGLIFMSNQVEAHNLETTDSNKLLAQFGLQTTNLITDAKKLVLPANTPIIGGLRWAFYTGNQILIQKSSEAKPRAVVTNDLSQKPEKGKNDQPGVLLAASELGKGRVVVATDSGWIADFAFNEEGVGGVAIKGQDNWEIFHRLARWAAGKD